MPSPGEAPLLPKLRGHFAEFLDQSSLERLGIFYLPTCVGLRYGPHELYLEAFLGSMDSTAYGLAASHSLLGLPPRICLWRRPTSLHRLFQQPAGLSFCVPPIARSCGYGNINPFPIDYVFRPRLRTRLTLGRLPLPRKPWVYDERVFHPF